MNALGWRIAAAAVGLVAVAVLAAALGWLWFLHWQPDRTRYPLRGIDVSHHQNAIDWREVAADDVAFAYLKASEGGDHSDRRYEQNRRGARAAGLAIGAYHFFTWCKSGAEQARNFLAAAPPESRDLPPALDLEFGGNCGRSPDGAGLRREIDAYLSQVEAAYGQRVLLYVTPEFLAAHRDYLPPRALWRRSIAHAPDAGAHWALWQYHNRGRVRGIVGPVDLNVFDGGAVEFARWRTAQAVPARGE